jgi:acyl carrier protein
MSELAERVRKIVVEQLAVDPNKVVDSAGFIDHLGADSLDVVEIVMALSRNSVATFLTTTRRGF